MTKEIPLTRGFVALVDDEDYDLLSAHVWYLDKPNDLRKAYAVRREGSRGAQRTIYMHRFLLQAPDGLEVDHINLKKLDNQRANLRLATRKENGVNRRPWAKSGFKGVTQERRTGRFVAYLTDNNRLYNLGTFATAEDAARAYDERARRTWGEFAHLNFPVSA